MRGEGSRCGRKLVVDEGASGRQSLACRPSDNAPYVCNQVWLVTGMRPAARLEHVPISLTVCVEGKCRL